MKSDQGVMARFAPAHADCSFIRRNLPTHFLQVEYDGMRILHIHFPERVA